MTPLSPTPLTDAKAKNYTVFIGDSTYAHLDLVDVDLARSLERSLAEQQRLVKVLERKVEELTMEYCPDEMTPEMWANWEKHQRRASPEDEAAISAAIKEKQ